jgi:hypothetical protein
MVGDRFCRGFPNPQGTKGEYVVLFPVPQEGPAAFRVDLARPSWARRKQEVSLRCRGGGAMTASTSTRGFSAKWRKPAGQSQRPPGVHLEVNRNLRV